MQKVRKFPLADIWGSNFPPLGAWFSTYLYWVKSAGFRPICFKYTEETLFYYKLTTLRNKVHLWKLLISLSVWKDVPFPMFPIYNAFNSMLACLHQPISSSLLLSPITMHHCLPASINSIPPSPITMHHCLPASTNSIPPSPITMHQHYAPHPPLLTATICFNDYLVEGYAMVKNWRKYFGIHKTKVKLSLVLRGLVLAHRLKEQNIHLTKRILVQPKYFNTLNSISDPLSWSKHRIFVNSFLIFCAFCLYPHKTAVALWKISDNGEQKSASTARLLQ